MYIPVVIPNLTCGVWKRVKIPKQVTVFFGPVRVFWEVQTPKGGNHTFFNSHLLVANHADNADPSRALMMTLRCPFQCYWATALDPPPLVTWQLLLLLLQWRLVLLRIFCLKSDTSRLTMSTCQLQTKQHLVGYRTCQESKTHASNLMILWYQTWSHAPVNYLGSPWAPMKYVLEQNLPSYMGHLTVVNGIILGYTHVSNWVFCSVNVGWTTRRPTPLYRFLNKPLSWNSWLKGGMPNLPYGFLWFPKGKLISGCPTHPKSSFPRFTLFQRTCSNYLEDGLPVDGESGENIPRVEMFSSAKDRVVGPLPNGPNGL